MVCFNQLVLGFFIVQIHVNAAPSDTKEVPTPVEKEQPKPEDQSMPLEINEKNEAQSQRQKRYYNFNGFPPNGFPPINPYYPAYNKRDIYRDTAIYGVDDPLTHIRRQLAEIATAARHPIPPPPINFPFYFPVFYIPQYGCDCRPQQPSPGPQQNQTGDPGVENRFPVLEDDRQNWGLVNNDTEEDYDENEDFSSRPISFDPIMLDRPMKRPPPPVEHGSTQGGQNQGASTTTVRPAPPPASPTAPSRGPSKDIPPSNQAPFAASYPGSFAPPEAPSVCDGAVISCCHQAQVTYSCFALQGCPDPTFYGNPCDPLVILRVIEKYQSYYGRRNG